MNNVYCHFPVWDGFRPHWTLIRLKSNASLPWLIRVKSNASIVDFRTTFTRDYSLSFSLGFVNCSSHPSCCKIEVQNLISEKMLQCEVLIWCCVDSPTPCSFLPRGRYCAFWGMDLESSIVMTLATIALQEKPIWGFLVDREFGKRYHFSSFHMSFRRICVPG